MLEDIEAFTHPTICYRRRHRADEHEVAADAVVRVREASLDVVNELVRNDLGELDGLIVTDVRDE